MRLGGAAALAVASFVAVAAAQAEEPRTEPSTAAPPPCVAFDAEQAVSAPASGAEDVAWSDDGNLYLAAPLAGIYGWRPEDSSAPALFLSGGRKNDGAEVWLPRALAVDQGHLVAASPVFALAWKELGTEELAGQVAFDGPMALDLDGDHLAVLGFRKDDRGEPALDGAIAWIGELSKGLTTWRPVLFSADGPGVRRMTRCAVLFSGQARFMTDGSLVLVPGVEPGAYRVDRQGRVLETWQNERLGFDADCAVDDAEMARLRVGDEARWDWLNRNRVVDEILPLPDGPGFVIRHRDSGRTTWELVRPRASGGVMRCRLPVESPSPFARLAADLRGDRLAVLIWTRPPASLPDAAPSARLLLGRVSAAKP